MFELAYHRKPESWRDYQYGLSRLGRRDARYAILAASVAAIAQTTDKGAWRDWHHEMRQAAGW